jgi:hypothetical protein
VIADTLYYTEGAASVKIPLILTLAPFGGQSSLLALLQNKIERELHPNHTAEYYAAHSPERSKMLQLCGKIVNIVQCLSG